MKRTWIPQAVVILLLLWALIPSNPYGYYIFLRLVCCAVFAYLAFQALAIKKKEWVWILGVTAVVYNPFLRFPLGRAVWTIVNLATIGIAIISIFTIKVLPQQKDE